MNPRTRAGCWGDSGGYSRTTSRRCPPSLFVLLAAELSGRGNDWILVGGWVWLAGRVVYLPIYAAGIPWVRTIVWIVATLGIVVMLVGLAIGPG